jgi:hypothetical protein
MPPLSRDKARRLPSKSRLQCDATQTCHMRTNLRRQLRATLEAPVDCESKQHASVAQAKAMRDIQAHTKALALSNFMFQSLPSCRHHRPPCRVHGTTDRSEPLSILIQLTQFQLALQPFPYLTSPLTLSGRTFSRYHAMYIS